MKGWILHTTVNGNEYAKFYGRTFKCCKPSIPHPADWIWVKDIQRYVSPKAY